MTDETTEPDALCDFCGETYTPDEAQCCAVCAEDLCEKCLENHGCEEEDGA